MNRLKTFEKGQVMVFLAVALVGLLGFTALAIDVGMIFSDRRYAQNVADASALAGAQAAQNILEDVDGCVKVTCSQEPCGCQPGWDPVYFGLSGFSDSTKVTTAVNTAKEAARLRAVPNLFTDLTWDSNQPGYANNHKIVVAPHDGNLSEGFIEVQVFVTSTPKTSFVHFFYNGAVKNSVIGIARVTARKAGGVGGGILSLDPVDLPNCGNMVFNGGGTSASIVHVVGGGIFSNSGIAFDGGVDVIADKSIQHVGCKKTTTSSDATNISPNPQQVSTPINLADIMIDEPQCGSGTFQNENISGSRSLSPGNYGQIKIASNNSALTLNPGLYCFKGMISDKDQSGIALNGLRLTGNGVTLFFIEGGLDIQGSPEVTLTAPTTGPYAGLLIYTKLGNTSGVDLSGSPSSFFSGTVFAPSGDINIKGNSSLADPDGIDYHTSLIGWNVNVSGDGNVFINYDEGSNYQFPSSGNMYK